MAYTQDQWNSAYAESMASGKNAEQMYKDGLALGMTGDDWSQAQAAYGANISPAIPAPTTAAVSATKPVDLSSVNGASGVSGGIIVNAANAYNNKDFGSAQSIVTDSRMTLADAVAAYGESAVSDAQAHGIQFYEPTSALNPAMPNGMSSNTVQSSTGLTVGQPTQTVAGQLSGLISANNPLIQQARTGALQQMNDRGLLNSSMAISAGDQAAYTAALPIAQADAQTYYDANKTSNSFVNQFATANNIKISDLQKLATQQGYNLETMSQQQVNALGQMAITQGFTASENQLTRDAQMEVIKTQTAATQASSQMSIDAQKEYQQISAQYAQQTSAGSNGMSVMNSYLVSSQAIASGDYSVEAKNTMQANLNNWAKGALSLSGGVAGDTNLQAMIGDLFEVAA